MNLYPVLPQALFTTSSPTFSGLTVGSSTAMLKRVAGVLTDAVSNTDYQSAIPAGTGFVKQTPSGTFANDSFGTSTYIPISNGTGFNYDPALTFVTPNIIGTGYTTMAVGFGVGIAPTVNIQINTSTTASATSVTGIQQSITNTYGGAVGNPVTRGLGFTAQYTPTLTTNRSYASGQILGATGSVGFSTNASEANNISIRDMYGFRAAISLTRGAGSTGTLKATNAFFFSPSGNAALTNSPTLTNLYAYYDPGMSGATNNWGIAINTPNNYINGSLRIGSAVAPTANTLHFASTHDITKDTNDLTVTTAAAKTIVLSPAVYGDLYVGLDASRVSGTTQTTFVGGNIRELVFSNNDTADFPSIETQHDYKEGTDIESHLHIATRGTNASAYHVRYTIEYTWANRNVVFPATTTLDVETTIPGGTAEFTHIYIDMGAISGAGKLIGSQLKFLLKKIASASSDAPAANNPYVLQAGFHYQKDTIGSRQEAVK
jgi:hypothetical protein